MILAQLGCSVRAVERIPALALWSHWNTAAAGLTDRLQVTLADALAWLATPAAASAPPQVVYLDPMFERQGKAQVKKEMQACRILAGPACPTEPLLAAARRAATERVVVKRHPDHPALADDVSFTVESGRIRFDVYLAPPDLPSAVNAPHRST